MYKPTFSEWFWMLPLIRKLHIKIVQQYIPYDNEQELADALYNWKYRHVC